METKECPICASRMRIQVRELTDRVPGTRASVTKTMREWICPECEYFEDADES